MNKLDALIVAYRCMITIDGVLSALDSREMRDQEKLSELREAKAAVLEMIKLLSFVQQGIGDPKPPPYCKPKLQLVD